MTRLTLSFSKSLLSSNVSVRDESVEEKSYYQRIEPTRASSESLSIHLKYSPHFDFQAKLRLYINNAEVPFQANPIEGTLTSRISRDDERLDSTVLSHLFSSETISAKIVTKEKSLIFDALQERK